MCYTGQLVNNRMPWRHMQWLHGSWYSNWCISSAHSSSSNVMTHNTVYRPQQCAQAGQQPQQCHDTQHCIQTTAMCPGWPAAAAMSWHTTLYTDHWSVPRLASSRSNVVNQRVHVWVETTILSDLLLHLSPLVPVLPLVELVNAVCMDTVIAGLTFSNVRVTTSQLLVSTSTPPVSASAASQLTSLFQLHLLLAVHSL